MNLLEMLQLWKEWGGAVQRKKGKRSDSIWAPENLSRCASTFSRAKGNEQSDKSQAPAKSDSRWRKLTAYRSSSNLLVLRTNRRTQLSLPKLSTWERCPLGMCFSTLVCLKR